MICHNSASSAPILFCLRLITSKCFLCYIDHVFKMVSISKGAVHQSIVCDMFLSVPMLHMPSQHVNFLGQYLPGQQAINY